MTFGDNQRRVLVGLVVFIGLAAAVVSTFTAPEIYPTSDAATTSIYALRAARGDLAVGAYSRFSWHHPGPLLYQVLAIPYAASGLREVSLKWAGLALNLLWLSSTFALVFRRSPRLAVAVACALAPLLWRVQPLLFATWNPFAPVLALPLAIAAAADLGIGGRWSLALLVATLSYCVQAHIGLLVPSVAVVVGAGVSGRLLLPTDASPWRWWQRKALLEAAAVGILLWAVPVVHEVRTWPGNSVAIARFFLDASNAHPSWARSVAVAANSINGPLLPSWEVVTDVVPRRLATWPQWWTAIQELIVAAAAIVAAWRGDRFESALAVVCAICTLSVPIAVHGIVGQLFQYLLAWVASLGALNLAVVIASAARWVPVPERIWDRAAKWLLMAFVACCAVIGAHRLLAKQADEARDTTIRALTVDLQSYCRAHGIERPLLEFDGETWQQGVGIVLQYYKADVGIAVPERAVFIVGEPFAPTGREGAEFYLMPIKAMTPPADLRGSEWVTTRGAYRIVRLQR